MKKKKLFIRLAWSIVGILVFIVGIFAFIIGKRIYTANIVGVNSNNHYLFIPTGSDFEGVVQILKQQSLLKDEKSFRWTANQMKYVSNVKAGKYELRPLMNNKELVTMLRSGKQVPVQVIFNNIRTKEQLAKRISEQIEAGNQPILNLMNDNDYTKTLGFTSDNILSMFIPDTYEFYWNTSADKFFKRMKKEYERFWTAQRLVKANSIGFKPSEISVIASIVQMESNKEDEKNIIAGVYINRLNKGWKLEADPTLVYALGDFTINRVLNVYKAIDSPYNTYKYQGLPPGPICLPTTSSLNAVLNYTKHPYMFFCAREDFSGYHNFASNYGQHLVNARKFQKALDKRGIRS